jgi:hypothetical protein
MNLPASSRISCGLEAVDTVGWNRMARGFESKDVEFQQSDANRSRAKGRALTPAEREAESKRRRIELALSKVRAEREGATNLHHRRMLDQAIQALEDELRT